MNQREHSTLDVPTKMVEMDGFKVHDDMNVTLEESAEKGILTGPFGDISTIN